MPDNIETEIRKALDAKAHEVEVPEGLAARTLKLADDGGRSSRALRDRMRAWRDARGSRARVTGYPRVLYAAGAGATAVLLFVVGAMVTRPTLRDERTRASGSSRTESDLSRRSAQVDGAEEGPVMDLPALKAPAGRDSGITSSGDASSGQVSGLTSGGGSADRVLANTSEDADAESGDGDFSDQAIDVEPGDADASSGFTGLTAGDETAFAPAPAGEFLDPQLVKTANIRVAVKDFDPAWDQANDVAAKYGGAVIGSRTQLIEDRIAQGTVTMRVPSLKLDQVIADLRGLGTLAELTTSGDDIAEQIDGVKDKVADAKTEERELLDRQSRAPTAVQRLEATQQLEAVRKDIDSLKAKQRKYEDQVEFSAVSATIVEDASVADDGPVLSRALEKGVSAALTILAGTLVILGGLLPLAAIALLVWFVIRAVRRRRAT
jgi:hypothetical protein